MMRISAARMGAAALTAVLCAACALLAPAPGAAQGGDIGKKMTDPVSMKSVTVTKETPWVAVYPNRVYFEDAKNRETFLKAPENYVKMSDCPVKGFKARTNKANRVVINDQIVYFCCAMCPKEFAADPAGFLGKVIDPVSGKEFTLASDAPKATHRGTTYYFESAENQAAFEKEPAKYSKVALQ